MLPNHALLRQNSVHFIAESKKKKKKWGEGGNFQRLLRAVTRFELFLKVTLQYLKGYVREVRELADHQSNPGETPGPETKRKQFGLCSR